MKILYVLLVNENLLKKIWVVTLNQIIQEKG